MRTFLMIAAATFAATTAFAQDGGGGGGGGPGGGGPSPERRAMFQAVRDACADDMTKLCGDKTDRREQFMCLRQNQDKASQACKDALSKLPPPRQQ